MNSDEKTILTDLAEHTNSLYSQQQEDIRKCIDGLNRYAAQLAVNDRQTLILYLRQFVGEIASFWLCSDGNDADADPEQAYRTAFDQIVEQSKHSGTAPELSDQVKFDVLKGLDMYAEEMADISGMEHWVWDCRIFASSLRDEWKLNDSDFKTGREILTQPPPDITMDEIETNQMNMAHGPEFGGINL